MHIQIKIQIRIPWHAILICILSFLDFFDMAFFWAKRFLCKSGQVQVVVQLVLAVISFNCSASTSGRDGLYRSVKLTAFLVLLNLLDEMEELGHYSGNWKVVRTVGPLLAGQKSSKRWDWNQHSDVSKLGSWWSIWNGWRQVFWMESPDTSPTRRRMQLLLRAALDLEHLTLKRLVTVIPGTGAPRNFNLGQLTLPSLIRTACLWQFD